MTELIAARRRMAIFLGLFLFVVVLLTSQARSPDRRQVGAIGTGVLTLLMPVQAGMARIADGVGRMWELYTEIGRLRVENARLRGDVEALSRKMAELREQAAAAQRLERLLELRSQTGYRALAAHVVGRDRCRAFGTLLGGQGGVFPKGLVVGRITRVVQEEGEYLQEAQVEPAAALDRLEEVLILLPR